MIFTALLLIANPALEAFDEAGLALTGCGFAAHREAARSDESLEQFKRSFANRCAGEIAKVRSAIISLETSRGKTRADASARADGTIAHFHANFTDGYARRHEDKAKLKALQNALERERKSDAQ